MTHDKKCYTCKDCLHYDACRQYIKNDGDDNVSLWNCFVDKYKWVHLPCRAGETLYRIVGNEGIGFSILQATAWRVELDANDFTKVKRFVILIDSSYTEKDVDIDEFGKTIFSSLDDAEKSLDDKRKDVMSNAEIH